jgi:hypothetical protein
LDAVKTVQPSAAPNRSLQGEARRPRYVMLVTISLTILMI